MIPSPMNLSIVPSYFRTMEISPAKQSLRIADTIFGIHFLRKGGETRHVGKQDGHKAAFALDLLSGGKNAFRQIARDVSLKK